MSSGTTGFSEEQPRRRAQAPMGMDYIPTEEERRVFRECNQESFWYRSVPFSVVSMAVTQALVARGTLSSSPRFGSLPKVVFAGFCGYLAGKMSYMKTCQEKFKRLENSPLGEALRQRTGLPQQYSKGPQSELSDSDAQSSDPMFQPTETPSQMPSYTRDYEYGFRPEPPMPVDRADDFNAPVQSYVEEEEPRRKPILYEDLRLKNRENYEVTLTQKAETLLKPAPEKERERPKKEVKKNIYGDTWEE
ncbi:OCIA domain-containing protein 1-like isoform X2 [Toxotes jaculatrix]|uniref:OCIA domain-containing protein 1-like isoform X2 n=1 Tax=Toxotes jaculatrix TaxID=941984 RepID=UPI001B3A8438|nr:OCIA domain-containing protein 1-like isoform X2 [Toxotes jaculatrix]